MKKFQRVQVLDNLQKTKRKSESKSLAIQRSRSAEASEDKSSEEEPKGKKGVQKMSNIQSFFAVCKCYCAINVLLTPKAFTNGGYLLSPIILLVACSL